MTSLRLRMLTSVLLAWVATLGIAALWTDMRTHDALVDYVTAGAQADAKGHLRAISNFLQERQGDLELIGVSVQRMGRNPSEIAERLSTVREAYAVYADLSVFDAKGQLIAHSGSASSLRLSGSSAAQIVDGSLYVATAMRHDLSDAASTDIGLIQARISLETLHDYLMNGVTTSAAQQSSISIHDPLGTPAFRIGPEHDPDASIDVVTIRTADQAAGWSAQVSTSQVVLAEALKVAHRDAWLLFWGGSLIGLCFVVWLAQTLTAPLMKLADNARALSERPTSNAILSKPMHAVREIHMVTDAFNVLLSSQHQRMHQVTYAQERQRMATRAGRIGVWDWDLINNRMEWDSGLLTLFGQSDPDNMSSSKHWIDVVDASDRARVRAAIAHSVATFANFQCQFNVVLPDGSRHALRSFGEVQQVDGVAIRMLGVAWDVTEELAARAELQRITDALNLREERLRLALESSEVGLWDWSIADDVVYFSPTYERMLGLTPGSLTQTISSFAALVHPDDLPQVMRLAQQNISGASATFRCEFRCRHADGRWLWILSSGRAISHSAAGVPLRMLGTHVDISPMKHAQAEILEARNQAEAAARAKAEFLATMSHEIRTPMNGVIGSTSLLLDSPLTADQRELLAIIRSSGETLLTLLNDILDFSKIEAGRMDVAREAVDVKRAIRDVMMLFAGTAAARHLTLTVSEPAEPCWITGDAGRLRQILSNLISNALKFTDTGGVTIRVARAATDPSAPWTIAIIDSGCGIPAEHLDKLFQRFSQVDHSFARRHGGTGLGLAISLRLAEIMHGRISIASTVGQGSTFTIQLPWCTPPANDSTQATHTEQLVNSRTHLPPETRILLAEDNPVNARVACTMLERMGATVDRVGNGREAVKAWLDGRHHLILMDCQMPDMDGLEATRIIRTMEATSQRPRITILALTANAFAEDRASCISAGMDDLIAKPITRESLGAACRKWLNVDQS